jgi:hypothetical protein
MYVNGKMRPVEIIPGMGRGKDEGEWWMEWIQLWYIVTTFVNVIMYPQQNNNKKRKEETEELRAQGLSIF